MKPVLEGSCRNAAEALALSPLATLALRLALMILRNIRFGHVDRSLKVVIGSSSVSIRVSRNRLSRSTRSKGQKRSVEPASGFTGTIEPETGVHPRDVSLSTGPVDYESGENYSLERIPL